MQNNIVEYFSGHDGYRCGYCKSPDTNFSHGMWAHTMTAKEYESLLNRGWRRSGKYLYKPTNHRTCCPCYTISCHALDYRASKSQKKVLKKFNHHLLTGILKSRSFHSEEVETHEVINYKQGTAGPMDLGTIVPQTSQKPPISISTAKLNGEFENCNGGNGENDDAPTPDTPKRRKSNDNPSDEPNSSAAKAIPHLESHGGKGKTQKKRFLRIERKKQKLASRGLNPEEELTKLKNAYPGAKEIEEFLQPFPNSKVKLEIHKVMVGTEEFNETFELEHALYQKYQMTIHNDEASECNAKQFLRFLCDNPLNEVTEDDCGCYHQQYYLDNKLVAVGVVDILPTCLSSVYFFYDPVFADLTLGTFGALTEIAFVRERAQTHPEFQFYYMGFYIHSCPKMRYKGSYTPSYLLCPETFNWKLLDDKLRRELDNTKYLAFGAASESDIPPPVPKQENIDKVSILYRRNIMPYGIYELQRSKDDTKEIQEYCNLIGGDIAQNICLYRALS